MTATEQVTVRMRLQIKLDGIINDGVTRGVRGVNGKGATSLPPLRGGKLLLTCDDERRHDTDRQRGSFVNEGLRQEVAQGQYEGPQRDVIQPAEGGVASSLGKYSLRHLPKKQTPLLRRTVPSALRSVLDIEGTGATDDR